MFGAALDKEKIYQLDKGKIYESVLALGSQIEQSWQQREEAREIKACRPVDRIVVVGMGGSGLGARVVKSVYGQSLPLPLEIINDYHLPFWVNGKTMVILSSYSGGTEEVLSTAAEAEAKEAYVKVIGAGGKLVELARGKGWPAVVLDEKYNPSKMPRAGVGLNLGALLGLLAECGYIKLQDKEIEEVVGELKTQQKNLVKEIKTNDNPAKRLAEKLRGKALILVSARHLTGAVHVFKNVLNESAKTFATGFELPELNHHLMEGLTFPDKLKELFHFLMFDSELYEPMIRKRLILTEEVLIKQGYGLTKILPESKSLLGQAVETIAFGGFASFYLTLLNKVDPSKIPWVEYFKQKMEE